MIRRGQHTSSLFLPAAGVFNTTVTTQGNNGLYRSSSKPSGGSISSNLRIQLDDQYTGEYGSRIYGYSVRAVLVED